jgi:hypothetical protein
MIQILDQVGGIFKSVADKFIPDAKDRLEAELIFTKQAHEISLGQIEINKIEAQHPDKFVSRGRPFIIWVCGGSFAYSMIVKDLLNWIITVIASFAGHDLPTLPVVDNTIMFDTLLALLGLGGLRTFEKFKGVATK